MDLSRLVSEMGDDLSDPACMENLLVYIEELQSEDDDYMQLIYDQVKDASITWIQPWYQKSRSLTRPLNMEDFEEKGLETFQTDHLTKEENDILAKNWENFRKEYDVPNKPESFARWRNRTKTRNPTRDIEKARNFVCAYLAQGLERTLYQVYKRFVARYAGSARGKFSETEEKIMSVCFQHKPDKAVPYCSVILSREPRGICNRLHTLLKGKTITRKMKWTLPEASKLMKSLLQHSELPLSELKDLRLDTSVWLRVQDDMEHNYLYLQRFWYTYLHVQIFVKYKVKLKRLRRKILKRLKKSYKVWTDIRWKNVLKKFPDGFTFQFLYKAVCGLMSKYPGNYRTDPLSDVVKFCLEDLEGMNGNGKRNEKCLKTLSCDKVGNLTVIKYDEEISF